MNEIRAEEPLMCAALIVGLLFVLLTAGCAGVKPSPPAAPSPSATPQTGAEATAPVPPPAAPPSPPAQTAMQSGAVISEPARAPTTPSTSAPISQRGTKATPPSTKTPPPVPPAQAPRKESTPPPDVTKQKPPPLDLASLETRLKETKAIGVLTKITLKNEIDDLLDQFRAFYQGKLKTTLAELRRPFDLLVLKVLSLLQDTDPALASAIVASREAIWGILSDPARFAAI